MFQEAMSEGRPFEKIVVYNLSRISRDIRFLKKMEQKLLEHGVEIVPLCSARAKDELGGLANRIFDLFNAKRAEWASDAVRRSLRENAKQGYWTGGKPPYGFRTHETAIVKGRVKKKLTPVPGEAEVIHKMFDLLECSQRAAPMTAQEIAVWLNENDRPARGGSEWTEKMVLRVLRNPVLKGEYSYGNKTDPDDSILVRIPGIVSAGQFEKAQRILSDHAAFGEKPRGSTL